MQADRSLRSVFVGNIPYDATEEKLRDIFSAVGPVLSFRIVFDRETGKPKGYGFCEYKDQETATSAIRNLNGHDLGGRQLRVDSASNERARDEPDSTPSVSDNQPQQHQLLHQAPPVAEPLVDAQTLINNVMCSLQPEQLFDLCKQLKTSLLVNPNETRQLLMQNPQLSYAILQSLVMIKAIDAQTAMNTLHSQLMQPAPLQPTMPMMAPMGPPLGGPVMSGPQAPPGAGPMVMQPQPIPSAAPMVMQPQVMNPYAFMGPNTMIATSTSAPQPSMPQPVGVTTVVSTPAAAPADPRLARQQQQQAQQQAQQQQQQQQQQSQSGMSEQERQAFLMQVVNMTDQEISLLPPDQQDKIYLLRRQYMPSVMSQ